MNMVKMVAAWTACGAMVAASAAWAEDAVPAAPRAGGPRARIEAEGGIVERMSDGPTVAVFYPAGEAVAKRAAEKFAADVRQAYGFAVRAGEAPEGGFQAAVADKAKNGAVLWIDRPADGLRASLLVAPEAPWARLDLGILSEGADDELLSVRLGKELWRGLAMMLGAANNRIEGCLMKSVLSLAELDALKGRAVCPMPYAEIRDTVQKLRIGGVVRTTYAKALKEGWAPEPVTDRQRQLKAEAEAGK